MNNQKLKSKFVEELKKRNANLGCPICGQANLSIEGPFSKTIQDTPGNIKIGGPAIPTLGVICNNCGYMREFAIGALGLLEEMNNKSNSEE